MLEKIEKPEIETVDAKPDGTYARFIVAPLERGYGTTLGNSLRRVLLSSLPGYAITSVKIDNVLHEFSTIPNVKEDVTEIVLNLKGVILKIHGDGPKIMYIESIAITPIAGSRSCLFLSEETYPLPLSAVSSIVTCASSSSVAM